MLPRRAFLLGSSGEAIKLTYTGVTRPQVAPPSTACAVAKRSLRPRVASAATADAPAAPKRFTAAQGRPPLHSARPQNQIARTGPEERGEQGQLDARARTRRSCLLCGHSRRGAGSQSGNPAPPRCWGRRQRSHGSLRPGPVPPVGPPEARPPGLPRARPGQHSEQPGPTRAPGRERRIQSAKTDRAAPAATQRGRESKAHRREPAPGLSSEQARHFESGRFTTASVKALSCRRGCDCS